MKQLMKHTVAALLLTIVWAAGTAHAQAPTVIKVNIPFEFNFGDKTFPAGDYSLVRPLTFYQHFLVLRDARGQSIASSFTNAVESSTDSATSKVTFRSVDGQKVLSEVWQQYRNSGEEMNSADTNTRSYVAKRRSSEVGQTAEGSQP